MAQATSRHGNAAVGVGRVAKGVGSECVCYRSNGTAVKILMISLHAPPENRHALYRATGIFTALHQSLKNHVAVESGRRLQARRLIAAPTRTRWINESSFAGAPWT